MRTLDDLKQKQALPLDVKIMLSRERVRQWLNEFGEDGCYISFSGGKDSTVLLHLIREQFGFTNIPAVFVDTGLEYPELREFVKTFNNVTWLKPTLNFKSVIEKYGYPFLSKNISHAVKIAKYNPNGNVRKKIFSPDKHGQYAMFKWLYLLNAPFDIDSKCCDVMKKNPVHKYTKETGRVGIVGTMACESKMRRDNWLKYGCNAFNTKIPVSAPLSFWNESDVLEYIIKYDIKIAPVYGTIIEENGVYKMINGCTRTGCMFCGFGCHLEKEENARFKLMKKTHPNQYNWIMKSRKDGGLGYKEVIDWLNNNGNLDIKY